MTPPPSDQFPAIPAEPNAPTTEERRVWAEEFTSKEQEDLGLRPVSEGGVLYCGVTHMEYAINGVTYAWPAAIKKLRWSLNFSRLGKFTDMDFKDRATAWFQEVEKACDRQFEYTSNTRLANILYTVQRLDGRSGVLADMMLPVGNVTEGTQLTGRFDDSEDWADEGNGILLYPVGLHETLHALGLGHKPTQVQEPALIAPSYNPLIRNLQAADIKELQRRYGPSKEAQPPPPEATPIGGLVLQGACGDQTVKAIVEFPSARTVSARIDVTKGKLKTTLSGTKPMVE